MAKRRELTPSEINAAERLQTIWNEKKKALGLTQEKVAQLCEWSNQSAFGAYLLARVPLNTDAVLRLAKVLKVHPTDIMPELGALLPATNVKSTPIEDQQGFGDEEEVFMNIFRGLTSKQKKDAFQSIRDLEQENRLVLKEFSERRVNRS
jgi:transcriptional regulator with XRE-family HTH domain